MNCKQCNTPLNNKREDAIYCNHNCQQKYFKRKKQILDKIEKTQREINFNDNYMKELEQKAKNERPLLQQKLDELTDQLVHADAGFFECKRALELDYNSFKRELYAAVQADPQKHSNTYQTLRLGNPFYVERVVQQYRNLFREQIEAYKKECLLLNGEITKIQRLLASLNEIEIQQKINNLFSENIVLSIRLKKLQEIDIDRLPFIAPKKREKGKPIRTASVQAYSGRDILSMQFHGILLGGTLGQFVGKLQRERCAIALTGDSGAGKTTFSYDLAHAFLQKGMSVAYFSLESGFTESTQQLIAQNRIDQYTFKAFDQGTLQDVRTEANNFDCVVIDSYSKISTRPEDFEALRQDFPKTIFIIIFQKTTEGKIRGGSSILFNSTATIDIRITSTGHRLALMLKSRYGTENFIFSIKQNRLLKADKNPINWKGLDKL